MRKSSLKSTDLRKMGLLKHYRIVRRWACKTHDLNNADVELLIYFDCIGEFKRTDFENGTLTYAWDNRRWNSLIKTGWIKLYRKHNKGDSKYSLYKISFQANCLIQKMYRIMLGEEDIPSSARRSPIMKGKTYMDRQDRKAIELVNKDKTR